MMRLIQLLGGLLIVFLAGAGGGIGTLAAIHYAGCDGGLECFRARILTTGNGITGEKPASSTGPVCLSLEEAHMLREHIANIGMGKVGPDFGRDRLNELWKAEANHCNQLVKSMNLICTVIDGGGAGVKYCDEID